MQLLGFTFHLFTLVLFYNETILWGDKWVWGFLIHKWQKFIWNHELKRVSLEDKWFAIFLLYFKGQIKPKADWRAIDCPKKRMNEFFFVCFALQSGNTWNLKSKFQVSSISGLSRQKNQINLFVFWENLWRANLLSVLSDL